MVCRVEDYDNLDTRGELSYRVSPCAPARHENEYIEEYETDYEDEYEEEYDSEVLAILTVAHPAPV